MNFLNFLRTSRKCSQMGILTVKIGLTDFFFFLKIPNFTNFILTEKLLFIEILKKFSLREI